MQDINASKQLRVAEEVPPTLLSLPEDILENVFCRYMELDGALDIRPRNFGRFSESQEVSSYYGTRSTPFLLCHINSRLRHVALGQTYLWSSVYAYNVRPQHLPLLEFWIRRAGPRPVHIDVEYSLCFKDSEAILETLSSILTKAGTLAHLTLILPAVVQHNSPDLITLYTFPLLRSFIIRLVDWKPHNRNKFMLPFASSPALHSVDWLDTFGPEAALQLPWHQITDLTLLYPIEEKKLFEILSNAHSLHTLRLGAVYSYPPAPPKSLIAPIKSLTIAATSILDMFFSQVSCPELKELRLENVHWHPSQRGWNRLRNLLRGPARVNLVHFTYTSRLGTGGLLVEEELLHLFALPGMATLKSLTVRLDMSDKLITFLTAGNASSDTGCSGPSYFPLPMLEHLSLDRCSVREQQIAAMVASRDPSRSQTECVGLRLGLRSLHVKDTK